MIGFFLVFRYARRRRLNDEKKPTSSGHNSNLKGVELRDTERPHEIDGNGRNEMPGTKARIVPVRRDPRSRRS